MFIPKACNMAMKAELLNHKKFKVEAPGRSYNSSKLMSTNLERYKSITDNSILHTNKFKEEKAPGKQKVNEAAGKAVQRNLSPYGKQY